MLSSIRRGLLGLLAIYIDGERAVKLHATTQQLVSPIRGDTLFPVSLLPVLPVLAPLSLCTWLLDQVLTSPCCKSVHISRPSDLLLFCWVSLLWLHKAKPAQHHYKSNQCEGIAGVGEQRQKEGMQDQHQPATSSQWRARDTLLFHPPLFPFPSHLLSYRVTEHMALRGVGQDKALKPREVMFLPHAAEQSQANVLCDIAHTNGTGLRRHRGTVSAICCQLVRNSAGKKVHSSSQLPWAAGVKPTGSPADTI